MDYGSGATTKKHETLLSFADLPVEDGSVMTIRTRNDPARYDVRVGLLHWVLPWLCLFSLFILAMTACQGYLAHDFGTLWRLLRQNSVFLFPTVPMLGLALLRRMTAMRRCPIYVLNKANDRLTRDGVFLSRLDDVLPPVVQQKWGSCGNLCLRLLLITKTDRWWSLVESPVLETASELYRYVSIDKRHSPFSNEWVTFREDRTYVDNRDTQILVLAHEIGKFLKMNGSGDVRCQQYDAPTNPLPA